MSWRALMRRGPTKSFTVVGDVAQTSAAGGSSSWADSLRPHIQDRLQVEDLTVNYRTPRRIMDRALTMAQAHRLPVTKVSSVRDGDRDPLIVRTQPGRLIETAADAAATLTSERIGRIAVIADASRIAELFGELGSRPQLTSVGSGSAGIDDEVAVMTAQDAKGLEFDAVVIVEPAELIDSRGAGDLYVAMTRPTTHLGVVHAQPLPAGIDD